MKRRPSEVQKNKTIWLWRLIHVVNILCSKNFTTLLPKIWPILGRMAMIRDKRRRQAGKDISSSPKNEKWRSKKFKETISTSSPYVYITITSNGQAWHAPSNRLGAQKVYNKTAQAPVASVPINTQFIFWLCIIRIHTYSYVLIHSRRLSWPAWWEACHSTVNYVWATHHQKPSPNGWQRP